MSLKEEIKKSIELNKEIENLIQDHEELRVYCLELQEALENILRPILKKGMKVKISSGDRVIKNIKDSEGRPLLLESTNAIGVHYYHEIRSIEFEEE